MVMSQSTEYSSHNTLDNLLEFQPELEQIKSLPSPRFLSTHIPYQYLPLQLKNGTGKIIYVQRNPKDLYVSGYNFLRGKSMSEDVTWGDYFEKNVVVEGLIVITNFLDKLIILHVYELLIVTQTILIPFKFVFVGWLHYHTVKNTKV